MLNIPADFSFTNSRNAEHVLLHTNLLAEVPEEVAEAQGFLTPRNNYAAAVGRETNCFQVNTSFTQTEKMLTTDRVRDNGFYFIANIVDVYVRYLRRKIDEPFEKKLLHTVRGVGMWNFSTLPPRSRKPRRRTTSIIHYM